MTLRDEMLDLMRRDNEVVLSICSRVIQVESGVDLTQARMDDFARALGGFHPGQSDQ